MIFHDLADSVDIAFCLVIFDFHAFQFVAAFLEKAEKAFFLFFAEVFQFCDYVCQHLSDFAHIFGADIVQSAFREISDLFLASGAVLHHHLRVGDVDLGGKIIYHFLFLRR